MTGGAALRETILGKCAPSAFVYASVVQATTEQVALCSPCSDWFSRLSAVYVPSRKRRYLGKQYIPMDTLILFFMSPHVKKTPDVRNTRRLLLALQRRVGPYKNPYTSFQFVGDMVACMSHMCRVKTTAGETQTKRARKSLGLVGPLDDITKVCRAWWELNGQCKIFGNAMVSAAIRRMQCDADEDC